MSTLGRIATNCVARFRGSAFLPMPTGEAYLASVVAMPDDLPDLRASHEDRDRVADALRVAGGDGRLTAGELDARLERALSARTLRLLHAKIIERRPRRQPAAR
jgi:uncharacterized protein DUF1707